MPETVGVVDGQFGGGQINLDWYAGAAADFEQESALAGGCGFTAGYGVPCRWILPADQEVLLGYGQRYDGGQLWHFS